MENELQAQVDHTRIVQSIYTNNGVAMCDAVGNNTIIGQQHTHVSLSLVRAKQDAKDTDRSMLLSLLEYSDHRREHKRIRKMTHPNTCQWIQQNNQFKNWFEGDQSSSFWCYGKPGAGKTVLTSRVVYLADFRHRKTGSTLAFFYCNPSVTALVILGSLVRQLINQFEMLFKPFPEPLKDMVVEAHKYHRDSFDEDELIEVLLILAKNSLEVFFILDGLDECSSETRTIILNFFTRLLNTTIIKSVRRVFISSREDLTGLLEIPHCTGLHIRDEDVEDDIRHYVHEAVSDRRELKNLGLGLKQDIKMRLNDGAQGMFLWVRFQIEDLCECATDDEIKEVLKGLPQGLDGTYQRCLKKIVSRRQHSHAFNALKWVSHAKPPFLLEELEECLVFDPWKRHRDASKRPNISIVKICANLVVIDEADGSNVVRLAHSTVKEFLEKSTTQKFLEDLDQSRRLLFDFGPSDLSLGEYCISYLFASEYQDFSLSIEQPASFRKRLLGTSLSSKLANRRTEAQTLSSRRVSLEEYRLLTYARANWAAHTLTISKHSPSWEQFRVLVSQSNGPWDTSLLKHDRDTTDGRYQKQFHWAIEHEHLPLLGLLRQKTAINLADLSEYFFLARGSTHLHTAAKNNRMEAAKFLLKEKIDVDGRDSDKATALHKAAVHGHGVMVQLLLDHGAATDAKDKFRQTPLILAAEAGYPAVVKKLLGAKPSGVDASDAKKATPLLRAASEGHKAIVSSLLEYNARIDKEDQDGRTPLWSAARNGHKATVKMLLEKGAMVDAKDKDGLTPLWSAVWNGHKAVVKMLLERGAEVDARDKNNRTPLSLASRHGNDSVANMLLSNGAEVNAVDDIAHTPLFWAVIKGHQVIVERLIGKGAIVNGKDIQGQTPLFYAAKRGNDAIVRILLRNGASIHTKNRNGRTPLDQAVEKGYTLVIATLRAHDENEDIVDEHVR